MLLVLASFFFPIIVDIYFIGTTIYQIWNLFQMYTKYFLHEDQSSDKKNKRL